MKIRSKVLEINEVKLDSTKLAGISVRTNNNNESDPAKSKIMPLYKKFFDEKIEEQIPNKINDEHFMGVYTDYESDYNGDYTLIIAKEVNDFENLPQGFDKKDVAAGKYLKFTNEGEMPAIVIETWKYIWNYFNSSEKYERAYTTDFEKYNKTVFNKVEIFIAIK